MVCPWAWARPCRRRPSCLTGPQPDGPLGVGTRGSEATFHLSHSHLQAWQEQLGWM